MLHGRLGRILNLLQLDHWVLLDALVAGVIVRGRCSELSLVHERLALRDDLFDSAGLLGLVLELARV